MTDDAWASLADPFVDGAYASVKGQVRTYVLHQQLLRHLPPAPAAVLDVGGGAGHQSLPLARLGYDVTILDPSEAMLARAEERVAAEPEDVRARVRLLHAEGERAPEVTGRRYDAVLCHGVLLYQPHPAPLVEALCACVEPGGVLSIMTLNARTMAIRSAVERRWEDAMTGFDASTEIGPLGVPTWALSVDDVSALTDAHGVRTQVWYGVLLFTDWTELSAEDTDVRAVAEVELEAGLRDPYRQLSRAFHVVGTRALPSDSQ